MKRFWMCLIACLVAFPASGAAPAETGPERFVAVGDAAMERGARLSATDPAAARAAYVEASAAYESARRAGGVESSALYRAIGNAYLLSDDLGRAILNYRRAEELIPHDQRARASLAHARSLVQTSTPPDWTGRLARALLWWRGVVPRGVFWGVFVGTFALGWAIALSRVATPYRPPVLLAAGAWLVAAVAVGSLASERVILARAEQGVVVADGAVGRNGPSASVYAPTFDAPIRAGVEVRVLERRDGWVRAALATGAETWLRSDAVEMVWDPPDAAPPLTRPG